jgi:hypothetical protein
MTACSGGEDSTPTQPFGEPHEREERERGGGGGTPGRRRGCTFSLFNNIYLIIIHLININCISFNFPLLQNSF